MSIAVSSTSQFYFSSLTSSKASFWASPPKILVIIKVPYLPVAAAGADPPDPTPTVNPSKNYANFSYPTGHSEATVSYFTTKLGSLKAIGYSINFINILKFLPSYDIFYQSKLIA